ncbi:MAG TPA: O-antigen ligase family protein [Bryobacteraceae bacterium]|jgi:O-antigen ligase|nr:O-antigen ligase family protein [Bryobacteraceae bacterium]
MWILLAALAGVLPLLITPGLLFHYDIAPRIVLLALLVAIASLRAKALAAGISALLNRRAGRWLCVIAAAQIFWLAVATATSARPWFSLLGSNWRRMGLLTITALVLCAVIVAAELVVKPAGISTLLRASAGAAILASIYGVAQYFDIDPLQPASAYHAHAGDSVIVRPPGTMGHADFFAWWLAIALFCTAGLAATEKGPWQWIGRAAAAMSGIAILFTGTRSAILAVAAGFAVIGFFTGIRFRRIHGLVALATLAVLAGFYFSPAGTRMRARVQWSASEPLGGARPLLWRDSMRMVVDRPVAGFGPETFPSEFPRYQSTDLARLLPSFYQESPHNMAIDALTSEGTPGFLLMLGWVAAGIFGAILATRGKAFAGGTLAPFLAAALVASSVAGIFSAAICGPLIATALVIAMLVAMTPEDRTLVRPAVSSRMTLAIATPISFCLLAYAVMLFVSDFNLARFQRAPDIAGYRRVVETSMPGAAEDLVGSRLLTGACGTDPACASTILQAAARATRTADNPSNAWYNLAILSAISNDPVPVEHALRTATALAPNWFKPHWALASLLALTGKQPEARAEARTAAFLDADKDAEVIQTFRQLSAKTQ